MKYLCIRLKKNSDGELAWALLSHAGIEVFSSTENTNGSIELYANLFGEDTSLLQQFNFIDKVEVCNYEGIDWKNQWETHGADYHDGFVHIDLHKYGLEEELPILKMEAGPGFGDLSHPSTRLILQLMPKHLKGKTVVDIGCGSGVLSIATAALGASKVYGIDIDDAVLSHARANTALNGFSTIIECCKPEEFHLQPPVDSLILMNMIQSEQAIAWQSLPTLHGLQSEIITSGVSLEERSKYLEKTSSWGWSPSEEIEEEGWLAFRFIGK